MKINETDAMNRPDWLDLMGFTQEQKETILRIGAEHEPAMPGITRHIAHVCLPALELDKLGLKPLRATTDSDVRALATKVLYAVLNRIELFPNVRACHREGFWCEWVYPYGFVPQGGCPRHD